MLFWPRIRVSGGSLLNIKSPLPGSLPYIGISGACASGAYPFPPYPSLSFPPSPIPYGGGERIGWAPRQGRVGAATLPTVAGGGGEGRVGGVAGNILGVNFPYVKE